MNRKRNIPQLRFSEFTNDWEIRQIGSLGSFHRGHTYSAENVKSSGLLVLRSNNIQNNKLDLSLDKLRFVNKPCTENIKLRKMDLIICMANGSKRLVGKSALFLDEYPSEITVGAFCSIYRSEHEFSKYLFQIEEYRRNLDILLSGTSINNLTNNNLAEIKIKVPQTVNEQTKIATFLYLIDQQIEKQQDKVKLLDNQKKGLMQKIFSQEIRFKGEDGEGYPEWEEKKLDEVLISISTSKFKILSSEILKEGSYEVVDQGQKLISGYSNMKDKLVTNLPIIIYGDHTTIIKKRSKPFIVGADGVKLLKNINDEDDLTFLYYALLIINVTSEGYKRHFPILRQKSLQYPCQQEQKKIANILSKIDELINKEKELLELQKQLKKGLLQQMFV